MLIVDKIARSRQTYQLYLKTGKYLENLTWNKDRRTDNRVRESVKGRE